ncbi:terminase large subunit domain-containing protein [Candidatus Sororendozoicomonas aggregata]|uniref:terminase large subunit domain-containing protein n=1 Tax=Candidatus Sororendozoicomonas aggregata TaxID=3073239 RepID=UPI002ED1CCE3
MSTPDAVLLPYQQRWVADESPLKIAEKSRRTGLTWAEAADAALAAGAEKSVGGKNHFYVGSNKEMAREFIEAVAQWARAFDKVASSVREEIFLDDDGDKEILTFVVYFPSAGFKVQALSSSPRNLRGMQGNVTIDEAAFHDRLAEVLKAALALTMWGAKVRLISTHNGVDNLFNELIDDSRAGKKRYSVHRITLDDALGDGLYQRICLVSGKPWSPGAQQTWRDNLLKDTATEDDALEEYFCVPKASGGSYLSRVLIEARMETAPVLRFEGSTEFNSWPEAQRMAEVNDWLNARLTPLLQALNTEQRHCVGEDFARSGDLTVIAPLAIGQDLKRRCPFIVELKNLPFRNQEQIFYAVVDGLPRFSGGKLDARGNGQYLAEQARYRYGSGLIDEVMLSQRWYLEHMPPFKAAFEDDAIAIPKDADILSDLRAIQVVKGVPKIPDGNTATDGAASSKSQRRHGDAAVALCLAWAASTMDATTYAYHPVSKQADQDNHKRRIKVTRGLKQRGSLL